MSDTFSYFIFLMCYSVIHFQIKCECNYVTNNNYKIASKIRFIQKCYMRPSWEMVLSMWPLKQKRFPNPDLSRGAETPHD